MKINVKSTNPTRRPLRNYFNRREQWRLFALVMGLGLVVLMMREAAREENWYWLTGQEAATDVADRKDHDYDTAYQPTLPPKRSDAIRILSPDTPSSDAAEGFFPGVDPTYLRRVEDNRTHKHPEEAAAWFNLWKVLNENESRFINPASIGKPTFGELFEQPDIFRGKLVTLEGTVRRAEHVQAAKNNRAGVEGYYRLIIRLRGGTNRPVFLYALDLPKHFPVGEKIDAPIEATAFFYKNWLYEANGRSWIAPVLLAKNVRWTPPPPTGSPLGFTTGLLVALGLAVLSALIAWWLVKRSAVVTQMPQSLRAALHTDPDIDPGTVEETARDHLRDLAAQKSSEQ